MPSSGESFHWIAISPDSPTRVLQKYHPLLTLRFTDLAMALQPSFDPFAIERPRVSEQTCFEDLPAEIQGQIFHEVLLGGSKADRRLINVEIKGTAPELVPNRPLRWYLPWVAELRLISQQLEQMISPIIAEDVRVYITRQPLFAWMEEYEETRIQQPLQISGVLPGFLRDVRSVYLVDQTSLYDMIPLAPVSVSDLPRLKSVCLYGMDAAVALHGIYKTPNHFDDDAAKSRVPELMNLHASQAHYLATQNEVVSIGRIMTDTNSIKRALRRFLRSLTTSFDSSATYGHLVDLRAQHIDCTRDNIIGLKSSTNLVVLAIDGHSTRMVGFRTS